MTNTRAVHYDTSNGPGCCGAGNNQKIGRRILVTADQAQVTCKSCLRSLKASTWTPPIPRVWEPTMCHHREIRRRTFTRTTVLCYAHGTHELVGEGGSVVMIQTAQGMEPYRFCDRHIGETLLGYATVTARRLEEKETA